MKPTPKTTPKKKSMESLPQTYENIAKSKDSKYEKKFDVGGGAVIPPYLDDEI